MLKLTNKRKKQQHRPGGYWYGRQLATGLMSGGLVSAGGICPGAIVRGALVPGVVGRIPLQLIKALHFS